MDIDHSQFVSLFSGSCCRESLGEYICQFEPRRDIGCGYETTVQFLFDEVLVNLYMLDSVLLYEVVDHANS